MALPFIKYFLLKEDIKHNLIWVYHRTKTHPDEHALAQGLFNKDVNERATYGKGLYTTFDMESQQGPYMKDNYGPYILRLKVNIEKYCILDPDVYQILHPQKTQSTLRHRDFWKYVYSLKLNIPPPQMDKEFYGSDLAVRNQRTIQKLGFNGMVFNGRQDGKVVVIWKPDTLTIHSYSTDDGKTWIPIKPKPLKENNEFENIWIAFKKTDKCPKLSFDVFEKFSDWLIARFNAHVNHSQVTSFFKKDENRENLLRLIRSDAYTKKEVRTPLVLALDPSDIWNFFLEFFKNNTSAGRTNYQFVDHLRRLKSLEEIPKTLQDEMIKELSKGNYGWNGKLLLSILRDDDELDGFI